MAGYPEAQEDDGKDKKPSGRNSKKFDCQCDRFWCNPAMCYFLNEDLRPQGWELNKRKMKVINDKLALKASVEKKIVARKDTAKPKENGRPANFTQLVSSGRNESLPVDNVLETSLKRFISVYKN